MKPASETSGAKYREVARVLKQELEAGKWRAGDRLPGEQDLAKQFDIAYMTLRQAVAELVEDGLLLRVRGKGTFVVDRDRTPLEKPTASPMVLLFPKNWARRDPYYYPEVLYGFQQAMEEFGYRADFYSEDILDSPNDIAPNSSIACMISEYAHMRMVERLRDNGYRVLGVNRYSGRRSIPCVHIDDAGGVQSAVDHLVELGHRRFGFICGLVDNPDAADRLRGFQAAIKRHNLKKGLEAGDDFTEKAGYEGAQIMLSSRVPPTAILCASDLSALGVIKAAHDRGLSMPQDLSIVGFGDFSVSDYTLPRLTTLRQTRLGLGRCAAEMLIQLASRSEVETTVLEADLIVRDSTAAAPDTE